MFCNFCCNCCIGKSFACCQYYSCWFTDVLCWPECITESQYRHQLYLSMEKSRSQHCRRTQVNYTATASGVYSVVVTNAAGCRCHFRSSYRNGEQCSTGQCSGSRSHYFLRRKECIAKSNNWHRIYLPMEKE